MSPFVLVFTDGTSFFAGLAMVLVSGLLLLRGFKGIVRALLTVLALVGAICVLFSATPLPLWAYSVWLLPAGGGLVLGNCARPPRGLRITAGALLLATTAGLVLAETPYHLLPRVAVPKGARVYVLGDSISAGLGEGERCWSEVLKDASSFDVVNLAEGGATVEGALRQARRIPETPAVVIVEIGGNDLLGGTDAEQFRARLEELLSLLHSRGHRILLMELPLPPLRNAFGRAQRDAAGRYRAALLPKRCFSRVLGMKGATRDGLHLSQQGHNAMAEIMGEVLGAQ